jgi:FMN phosphatase YigB (HAD superfamily)
MAARYHAQRPWFPEAVPWLEDIRRRYCLCMASDADEAMVGEHVRQYPFDRCFTSERLRVYKGDAQNRFFRAIVGHYALAPGQMLHVGDTPAEIVAAQRVGLQTCWVNRSGRSWPHGRMEVLHDFAMPMTVSVIAQIVGLPHRDRHVLRALSEALLSISRWRRAPGERDRPIWRK